jgi:rhodanese-related sulfurtransferase
MAAPLFLSLLSSTSALSLHGLRRGLVGVRRPLASTFARISSSAGEGYCIREVMEDVVDGRAQLIDCRELHEWQAGHLVHAKLAPLSVLQQGILPDGIEPDEKIYLHCAAGVRVHAASPLLRQLGCQSVVPLREGFASLLQLGMPLDTEQG